MTPRLLCLAGLALACLPIAGGGPAQAQQPDRVRVELVGAAPPATALALMTAKEADLYRREGIEVFIAGRDPTPAVSGPHLRLWHSRLPDVMLSNRDSQDMRLVLATSRRLVGVAASIIAIEEKRDLLLRFMRATIEGNYLALGDASLARKVLARDAGIKGARAVDSAYRDFQNDAAPDMDISVAKVGELLKANKFNVDAATYVDDSLLAELRKEGFFAALEKKYGKR